MRQRLQTAVVSPYSTDNAEPIRSSSPKQVLEQVERVLRSDEFHRSARLARLLRFLIDTELQGQTAGLKESVIGREVYDRGSDFDGRTDPIVRTEVRRLRRKLSEYYATPRESDLILIDVPKGGYRPVFTGAIHSTRKMHGQSIGPYEVMEELDSDAGGAVYRVLRNGQEFAMRLPPRDVVANVEQMGRLRRDVLQAAVLEHVNIARVYGVADEDGTTSVLSRYYQGTSLEDRICCGDFPWPERWATASQVLEGMAAAHSAGVAHGNLGIADVLLVNTIPGTVSVRIQNFGTGALFGRTELLASEALCGRPASESAHEFERDVASVTTALQSLLDPTTAPAPVALLLPSFLDACRAAGSCIAQRDAFHRLASDVALSSFRRHSPRLPLRQWLGEAPWWPVAGLAVLASLFLLARLVA